MKIIFKIDKDRNFLALIHNLNRKNNPQEYEPANFFKDYKIHDEMRKTIRTIISKKGSVSKEIAKVDVLRKIYLLNKAVWDDYWEKNLRFLKDIKARLDEKATKINLSKIKKCARFFESKIPKEIIFYLCAGAINEVGRGTGMSDYVYILFPRKFNFYNELSISHDFAVVIHEIVHVFQKEFYYKEEREFIEAVTRAFAPRGILINRNKIDKDTIEEKMIPVIEKAIENGKSFQEIKPKLLQIYSTKR